MEDANQFNHKSIQHQSFDLYLIHSCQFKYLLIKEDVQCSRKGIRNQSLWKMLQNYNLRDHQTCSMVHVRFLDGSHGVYWNCVALQHSELTQLGQLVRTPSFYQIWLLDLTYLLEFPLSLSLSCLFAASFWFWQPYCWHTVNHCTTVSCPSKNGTCKSMLLATQEQSSVMHLWILLRRSKSFSSEDSFSLSSWCFYWPRLRVFQVIIRADCYDIQYTLSIC